MTRLDKSKPSGAVRRGRRLPSGSGGCAERWILGACVALLVAAALLPSENAASRGSQAIVSALWLVLALAWSISRVRRGHGVTLAPVDLLIGLFAVWLVFSAWLRGPTADARATWNVLWQWLGWLGAYWIVRDCAQAPAARRALLAVMICLTAGQSGFGFYQRIVLLPQAERLHRESEAELLSDQGIAPTARSSFRSMWASRLSGREPTGTFLLTNSLACALALALTLGCAAFLESAVSPAPRERSFVLRQAGLLSILGAIATCLYFTHSRAGLIAALTGVAGAGVVTWKCRSEGVASRAAITITRAVQVAMIVAAPVVIGWSHGLMERSGPLVESLKVRREYWQASWTMIRDMPLLGCGLGNFQDYYASYKLPQAGEMVADPHNAFLEIATTAGLPAAFLFFVVTASWLCRRAKAAPSDDREQCDLNQTPPVLIRAVGVGALSGVLLGYLAGALTLQMAPLAALFLGLPCAWIGWVSLRTWIDRGKAPPGLLAIATGVMLVHWTVSGGVTYAGLATLFWFLGALTDSNANWLTRPFSGSVVSQPSRTGSGRASLFMRIALPVVAAAGVAGAYVTMVAPLNATRPLLARASLASELGRWDEAVELTKIAAEADPWSVESVRQRAEAQWWVWRADRTDKAWQAFTAAAAEACEKNPRSCASRAIMGNLSLAAYRLEPRADRLEQAIGYYAEVTRLYPSSAIAFGQLAWAYHLAENESAASDAARESLRLDVLQRQPEQRLSNQSLFDEPIPAATAQELVSSLTPPG